MERKYISVKELSVLMGIGVVTIYKRIKGDKLPSYKVGGKRLFDKDEVMAWMKEHKVK